MLLRVIICLLVSTCLIIFPVSAAVWTVDDSGGADFATIQGALDAASSGDTILISAGNYDKFAVTKPYLTLTGEGANVVTVNFQGDILDIPDNSGQNGTGTILAGMKVIIAGGRVGNMGPASDTILHDCIFEGMTASTTLLLNAPNCTLANSTIINTTRVTSTTGVDVKNAAAKIVNNTFRNIPAQTTTLYLRSESTDAIVKGNLFDNCTATHVLTLQYTSGGIVANNTFKNNPGNCIRIWKTNATNNTIVENEFGSRGIFLYDAGIGNKFYQNNNLSGVTLQGTAASTIFWNSTTPLTYTYKGASHTGYPGNFWSNYRGTDTDSDGIIDTPNVLPSSLGTDYAPLVGAWKNDEIISPAVGPFANFTADIRTGTAPLTVTFTDQSTGSPTTWAWDFTNDGTVDSTEQSPSNIYDTAGTYTVNLTVTNAGGSDSEVKTDYITVSVPAPALLWGPYLTGTTTTGTVVNAKTTLATNLTVEYATDAYYAANSAYDKTTTDSVSTQLHHVALTRLTPGTLYHYRVVYDGIATSDLQFSSFRESGPFTFVMYSDTQDQLPTFSQLERHKLVADRIAEEPDIAFVLNSGDLVNDAANLSNWDRYFAAGKMMMANTTVYTALGNHEDNSTNYYQVYGLQEYYSFDCADSHISVLDSNDYAWGDLPVQSAWLANDLMTDKQFKFVLFHHPLYTSETNHFGGWTNLREAWEGDLNKNGVAAVFNGHVHAYERFLVNDTSYFVAGIGGAPSYNLASPRAPGSQKSLEYALGYIKVTVDPAAGTATAQMIRVADVSANLKNLTTIYPAGTVFETVIINRSAQQQNESRLVIPSSSLPGGMSKTVPVMVKNITQASGIAMTLNYDPGVMHITNISLNRTLADSALYTAIDNTSGIVKIAIIIPDATTLTEQSGIIDLTILATGSSGSSTSLEVTKPEWTDSRSFINRSFSVVTTGTVGVTTRGDLNGNGDVDIGDVAWLAYMVVGHTPEILPDADFNNNGRVEVSDAAKIAWFYVGRIPAL